MSPVPKIGRSSEKPEKSEFLKAADNLAAQSRILRRVATQEETQTALLDRLRRIGNEIVNEEFERAKTSTNKQVAVLQPVLRPLIEKAREFIADAIEARKEAKPVLEAIDSVNWRAIQRKLSDAHGFTRGQQSAERLDENGMPVYGSAISGSTFETDSTKHRISRLLSAVKELKPLVETNSDSELRGRLHEAEYAASSFSVFTVRPGDELAQTEMEEQQRSLRYAMNSLRQGVGYGSVAESIRGRLAGVKKLLAEIGEDVLAMGSEEAN